MISYARQNEEKTEAAPLPAEDHIAPAPRVSVQAFCETVETAAAVQSAGEDRRLGKAHLKIQMGGMAAAIEAYRSAPTPNGSCWKPTSARTSSPASITWRLCAIPAPASW